MALAYQYPIVVHEENDAAMEAHGLLKSFPPAERGKASRFAAETASQKSHNPIGRQIAGKIFN